MTEFQSEKYGMTFISNPIDYNPYKICKLLGSSDTVGLLPSNILKAVNYNKYYITDVPMRDILSGYFGEYTYDQLIDENFITKYVKENTIFKPKRKQYKLRKLLYRVHINTIYSGKRYFSNFKYFKRKIDKIDKKKIIICPVFIKLLSEVVTVVLIHIDRRNKKVTYTITRQIDDADSSVIQSQLSIARKFILKLFNGKKIVEEIIYENGFGRNSEKFEVRINNKIKKIIESTLNDCIDKYLKKYVYVI